MAPAAIAVITLALLRHGLGTGGGGGVPMRYVRRFDIVTLLLVVC